LIEIVRAGLVEESTPPKPFAPSVSKGAPDPFALSLSKGPLEPDPFGLVEGLG
jgi:hypothetical protein